MARGGWAILEVDVGEAGTSGTIGLVHVAYSGARGPVGDRTPWSATQLDALVALVEALAQQAAGRRGSSQDVPALLQHVREHVGIANGG